MTGTTHRPAIMYTDQPEFERFIFNELQAQGVASKTAASIASTIRWDAEATGGRQVQGTVRVVISPFPAPADKGGGWWRDDCQSVDVSDDAGVIGGLVEGPHNQPVVPHLLV